MRHSVTADVLVYYTNLSVCIKYETLRHMRKKILRKTILMKKITWVQVRTNIKSGNILSISFWLLRTSYKLNYLICISIIPGTVSDRILL